MFSNSSCVIRLSLFYYVEIMTLAVSLLRLLLLDALFALLAADPPDLDDTNDPVTVSFLSLTSALGLILGLSSGKTLTLVFFFSLSFVTSTLIYL